MYPKVLPLLNLARRRFLHANDLVAVENALGIQCLLNLAVEKGGVSTSLLADAWFDGE